jgi:PiT family inorganic phosphate transporter
VGNDIIPLRYINAVASQFMSALTVEVATLFNIPFSNTASFIVGVYGAGISYRERVILRRPIVMMVGTWVITALVGFVAGYVVMQASAIIPSLLAF